MTIDYPYEIIQNWGKDFVKETESEVLLHLALPIGSMPFYRERGTTLAELDNTPVTVLSDILAGVTILQSLADYSNSARFERRVATSYDLVKIENTNKKNGELDISVGYYRVADESYKEAAL